MAIPTFDMMLRPILAIASERDISRRFIAEAMSEHFELSTEERTSRIPSGGSTYVENRSGWAMTWLTKGGLIAKVAPRTYRATDRGREFLARFPNSITGQDLEALEGWEEAWKSRRRESGSESPPSVATSVETPAEVIEGALKALNSDLRERLFDAILAQPPLFFEELVLDVIVAMGYGGSKDEAAQHLGRSNDEGIDGRINQDPLGLDQILIQAKRYARDRVIDRKSIQAFIGSLAGQGVTKGIFITTSSFADSAKEFILRGSNTKVVLIDGDSLLDLMLRHHIGVRVERVVEILTLDQNYFEDLE
jgi:restriction system protein